MYGLKSGGPIVSAMLSTGPRSAAAGGDVWIIRLLVVGGHCELQRRRMDTG